MSAGGGRAVEKHTVWRAGNLTFASLDSSLKLHAALKKVLFPADGLPTSPALEAGHADQSSPHTKQTLLHGSSYRDRRKTHATDA